MNDWVKTVLEWAKTKGNQVPNVIKEVVDNLYNQPSLSVSDLANVIMFHPDTETNRNEWLGLTFYFYRLKLGEYNFCLETKGNENNYILMCQVSNEDGIVSKYTSYDEDMSLQDRMKVPLIKIN